MRLLHVVGARPNFMKAAPVMRAARAAGFEQILVHTGQHFDERLSQRFFDDLALPAPDVHLGVGAGSHAEQTARVMLGLEPIVARARPDFVVVVGDVNSTVAAALTAAKLGVPLAHVEAGLRSFDRTMPEELNRIVTDALADLLLTPSPDGDENLRREGRPEAAIRRVGNVMIDALDQHLPAARARHIAERMDLPPHGHAVLTLHRPANVDRPERLMHLLGLLGEVAHRLPVIFPVHPRTRARLAELPSPPPPGIRLVEPLGYLDFLGLLDTARLALTDSGGIQEETTALGIPCLTLRSSTERPITVSEGTNVLVGDDAHRLREALEAALGRDPAERAATVRPALWDGHAAERIVAELAGAA